MIHLRKNNRIVLICRKNPNYFQELISACRDFDLIFLIFTDTPEVVLPVKGIRY